MSTLCAPADIKKYTNVSSGFTGKDTQINSFIEMVSSQVRTLTRREFNKRERTQFFVSPDGSATGQLLKIAEPPIDPASFFSVCYSPTGDFREGRYSVLGMSDMTVDYEEGDINVLGYYEYNRKGFRITYTGGYPEISVEGVTTLDVPEDVRRACALQCAYMFRRTSDSALGKISQALDTGKTDVYDRGGITGLIREVSGPLVKYRRAMVGRS